MHEYPHEDGDEHVREDDDEAVFVPGLRTLIELLVVLDWRSAPKSARPRPALETPGRSFFYGELLGLR